MTALKSRSHQSRLVSTLQNLSLDSLNYPKVLIFVKILIETLDFDFKNLVSTVEKILTGFKNWSRQIETSLSRLLSTVEISEMLSRSLRQRQHWSFQLKIHIKIMWHIIIVILSNSLINKNVFLKCFHGVCYGLFNCHHTKWLLRPSHT